MTRPTRTREYCVQYSESDFDFVARLLAFEGIYSSFDEEGTMILDDRSSAAAPVEGGTSHFELIDAAGALRKGALLTAPIGVSRDAREACHESPPDTALPPLSATTV